MLSDAPGPVARIFNLLYRKFSTCRSWKNPGGPGNGDGPPIKNRRYSRLQICATNPNCATNLQAILRMGDYLGTGGFVLAGW